jgi:hypothetical protein
MAENEHKRGMKHPKIHDIILTTTTTTTTTENISLK